MKEKHKNGCTILTMTFTNLEKYVFSKKCLKQRRQFHPPPPFPCPSLQQSWRYFGAENVTWLRTNEIRGFDGCSSQPRGERGATMEEGEV